MDDSEIRITNLEVDFAGDKSLSRAVTVAIESAHIETSIEVSEARS